MAESSEHGARLLAIAREALERGHEPPGQWAQEAAWLREPRATFVTLRLDGELRGCIGTIDARRPLGEDVACNARAAAYRDPRFAPVSDAERASLEIEVSVLSPRAPLAAASEADALAQLRPGIDGVYLQYGGASATFLPQVWENLPDPRDFLDALRHKAGLPPRFWHPDMRLSRYTVEKFA